MTWIYPVSAIACGIACLGLTFAIGADWRNVRPTWRPVLIAGAAEHGALLYLCLWLWKHRVDVDLSAVLLAASIVAVALSALYALIAAWRTGELTSPTARGSSREQSH